MPNTPSIRRRRRSWSRNPATRASSPASCCPMARPGGAGPRRSSRTSPMSASTWRSSRPTCRATQRLSDWDFDLTFTSSTSSATRRSGVARSYVSSNIVKGHPSATSAATRIPRSTSSSPRRRPDSRGGSARSSTRRCSRSWPRSCRCLAARARVPDHLPLQRQGPRHDRDRHQRRGQERLEAVERASGSAGVTPRRSPRSRMTPP